MEHSTPSFGILDLVQDAVEVCSVPAGERGVQEWMDLIGEVSAAMTVLAAARDAAIVRLAAIDEVVTEDGVIGEQVNGLGTVSLDAAAMVSTATGASTRFGDEMVTQAVTRVVRVPALHEAMLSGVLDEYRARCVGAELTEVPPALARVVVDAVAPVMREKSGPALRRRTRDILFSLAPELLRERIRKARNNVGLRRWLGEPGTDSWSAVFPSERAASTWVAIDTLARRYKDDGKYPTLEQSRAYALLDLVDGSTTVETVLHLTVPAEALDEATDDAVDEAADERAAEVLDEATDEATDDAVDEAVDEAGSAATPSADSDVASVRECSSEALGQPVGRVGETFVAAAAAGGGRVCWMPLNAVSGAVHTIIRSCHPSTGALVDGGNAMATRAYRPGEALKALIRLRDGRCRFPGCAVPARQCDLDHVIAWPNGPTDATNLICLCRRHHRVKQRHRWWVRLLLDGVVEWTDPAGRRIITEPVDHLRAGQVRTTHVTPATSEDIAELVEWERIAAQFDPHADVDLSDVDVTDLTEVDPAGATAVAQTPPTSPAPPAAPGADDSEAEEALRKAVVALLTEVLHTRAQALAERVDGQDGVVPGSRPTRPHPWRRKRFGTHTTDLDRIPRPGQQGYRATGPPDRPAPAQRSAGNREWDWGRRERGQDQPPLFTLECRFDAGSRPGLPGVRYRPSRRHRRRAAYLAAGGPPF